MLLTRIEISDVLSSLGVFLMFFSMYLFMTVPTKLSSFSRFVIHGHDLTTGFAQLYMTIGMQTYVILPCASLYNTGFLTRFEIISTINQLWIMVVLFLSSSMFSLLLGIHRAFAVSMSYFIHWLLQIICVAAVGLRLKDSGERGRIACIEKVTEYPVEMDTMQGGAVELVGVGVPCFILVSCAIFNMGNLVVAHFSILLLCIYPISGPYYVLMSNSDYNKRVNEIKENVCSKLCFFRSARKVTSVHSAKTITL
ncbi:unnamed protein product [Auanema sp. JU1783]|nr:unnamed protein product [Auanema sp. JU1783]